MKSKDKILFLSIIILAFILRLFSLNQSFWLDEAVQVWASSLPLEKFFTEYVPGDFNPPLYYLLMHLWMKIFGSSEAVVRMLSVILGTGCVWLIWRVVKEIEGSKNNRLEIMTVLLLATSPLHIYYSQEARMYVLACFGFLLSIWRFLEFWKKMTLKNGLWLAISFLLMGLSHHLTLLSLPIFLGWGVWRLKKRSARKSEYVLFLIPFLLFFLGYLFYLPLFFQQLKLGSAIKTQFPGWGKIIGRSSLKAAALLPVKFVIGRINIGNKLIYGLVAVALVLIYWGTAIVGVIKAFQLGTKGFRLKLKVRDSKIFLLCLLFFIPPGLGFLIGFWLPIFSYFRFFFILPLFYLLIAMGLQKQKKFLIGVLITINLICSGTYLLNSKFHRENWQGMVEWLHQKNKSYEAPVLILEQVAKPFEHYDRRMSKVVYLSRISPTFLGEINEPVIYLISYGLPIFDPEDKIRRRLQAMGYQIKSGESFNSVGIEIWR